MTKKNVIISFKKLEEDIKQAIEEDFPDGVDDLVRKYTLGPNKSFYAFPFATEDTNYLIKVDVRIDTSIALEDE